MKSISTALIVCFLFQELSYANPDLKSIQLSFSPKFLTEFKIPRSVAVVEDIYQESSKPFTEIVNTSSPNILAGDRTDSRQKHAGMTVILIQDAHINESAQKNIAKVLDIIFKSQTRHPETWRSLPAGRQGSPHDEIPYVFLEAGTGNDSLSFLRQYATQTKREEVAKSYLKKGYIQGPDYLDLTSDRNFILWGVEDKTLYFKGLEDYRFLKDKREHLNAYLDKVTRAAKTLKSKIYNPSLQSFDGKREAFLKGDLSLTDYFDVLVAEAKKLNMSVDESFPYLAELQRIKEKEAGINFSKASEEEMRAFSSLSEEDQKELVEESKKQNSPFAIDAQEHKEAKAFYAMLEEKLTQAAFSGDRLAVSANQSFAQTPNRQPLTVLYPELTKYFAYLKETEKLNPEKILAEKENLEAFIYASLTRSKDEKRLTQVSKSQEVLKRLFNLSLTSQDFEELERDHKNFDIVQISGFLNKKIMDLASHYEDALFLDPGYEEAFQKAREFYDLTRERDRVFVKNILQKMDEEKLDKAILVAGGYHTEHLKVLLKEKSISYVSIIPQVLQETNMKKYESILLNQVDSRQEMEHQSTKAPGHHAVILSDPERAKRVEGESKDLITNKEIPNKWGVLSGAEATAMVNGSRLSVVDLLKEGLGAPVTASVIASHREAKAKQSDLSDRHTTAKAPTFAMTDKFSGARLAADKKWYQQEARERLDPKLVTGNLQRIRNILGSILNQIENPDQWLEEEHLEPDVIHRYGRAIRRFDQVVLHRKHMTAAKLEKEYRLLHALLGEKGYIRKAGDYSSEKEGEEVKQLFEYLFSEEVDRKIKQDESGAIEVAAYVYATLVNLQPFYDGNKRTASLIMNYILLKFGYTPFILDEDNVVRYAQIVYPVNEANKISERAFREFLESQVKKSGSRLAKNEGEPSLSTNGARLAGLYIMAIDLEKEFDKKKAREFLKELVSTPLTLAKVRRSTSFKFSMNEIRKNSDNRAYVMTVVRSVKKLMESKSSAVQSQTRAEKIELPFGLVMEKTQQGIVSGVDSIVGWIIDQGYEPSLFLRLYRQALRHAEYVYSTEGPAMAKKEDIHPQTGLPSLLLSQNLYNQLKEFAGNVHDFVPYIMAIPREAKGLMMAMAAKEELRSVTEFSQKTLEDAFDLFDRMIQATQQRNLGSTLTEVFMLFFNTLNQIPVVVNLLTTYSQEIVESSVKVLAGEHLEDLEHQRALKWAADKKLFSVDQATYEGSLNRYFHPDENDIFAQNLYYIWRMYLRIWASDASLFYSYSSGVTLMALLLLEVHKFLDSNGQIGTNPNLVARMFAGEQPARQEFANSASTLFEPTRQLAQELDSRVTVVSSEMLKKLENLTGARLAKNEGKPSLSANGARLAGFGQRAEVREETTDNLSSDKEGSRMASLAAAQTPTFFSRVVNLFSWLGVAIRTASLRVLSSISTVVNLSSTLSSRSVLAVTASVTVLKSLFRSSTSAATSLGVNDSGSLDMRKTISNQFNLVKPETTTEGATGARLALREKIQEAQTHLRNAMTVLDPEWEKPKKISLLDIAADYRDQNVPKPYLNETSLLAEFYGAIKILKEAMLLSDSKNPIVDAQAVLYRLGRIEVMLAPLVWVLKDQASEFPNTVIPFKLEESKKESLRQILLQAHLLVKTIGFELRNEYLEPGGLGTDHGARLADQRDNVQEHILAASNTFKVAEKLISPETISKLGELAPKLADIKEKIATATQLAEQLKTDFDNSNLKQQVSSALTELIKDSKVAQNRVYSLEKIAQRMVGGQFLDTDVEYNLFGALMNSVINEFEQASEKLSGARLATETSSRTPARVSEQEAPDVILAGARLAVPVFEDERTWIRRIIKEYADLLGLKDTLEKEKYAAPIKTDENLTRHSAERMSAELNRANYSLAARAMRVGYQNLQKRSWFGPFFRFTAKGRRILSLINEVGKRGSAQKGGPSVQAANPPDSPFPPIDETKLTERGDQGARLATDEEVSRNAQEILNKSEYAYLRQIYLEYKRKEVAGIDNWAYRLGISPQIRGHIQEVAGELIAAKHIEEHIKGAKLIGLGLSLGKGEVLGNLEVDNVFRIGDQVLIAEVKQDDITPHFRGKVKGILSHQVQRQARVVDALVSSRLQVAIRYGVVGIGTKIISLEDQEKDLGVFKRVGDIAMYRPGQISIRSAERTYPVYFMPLKERIIDMPSKGKVPLAEPPQVNSQGESFIEVLHGYFALSPLSDEQLQKPPQLMDTGVAWDENFKKAIKWEQLFPRITRTINRWISNVEKSQVIEGKITKQDKDLVFTALSFFYREGLRKGYSFNSLKREFANVYERENGIKKAWETLKKHGQQLQLGARLAARSPHLASFLNLLEEIRLTQRFFNKASVYLGKIHSARLKKGDESLVGIFNAALRMKQELSFLHEVVRFQIREMKTGEWKGTPTHRLMIQHILGAEIDLGSDDSFSEAYKQLLNENAGFKYKSPKLKRALKDLYRMISKLYDKIQEIYDPIVVRKVRENAVTHSVNSDDLITFKVEIEPFLRKLTTIGSQQEAVPLYRQIRAGFEKLGEGQKFTAFRDLLKAVRNNKNILWPSRELSQLVLDMIAEASDPDNREMMTERWLNLQKFLAKGARLAIPASRLVSLTDFEGTKDYFRDLFDWRTPPGYSYKVKGGTDGYYWVKNTYKVLDPDNAVLARLIHAGQARYKDNEEHTAFIVDKGIGEESINALKAYVKAYDINQVNEEADIDGAVEKYIKVIQGGEQVKDEEHGFEHVKDILGWLAGIINRKNTVVIIGGGALLDMAALAAALYSRGVKTVLRIPTTSQSQDDSGVAVKYGINFAGKKNKVGGFGAAYGVIIDNNFLKTQDERSYRAGLIEIVKVALMKDKKFFHYLNRYYQDVLDKKFDTWETGEGVISRMRLFLKKIVRRPVYRNKAETIVNHAAWLHARQISTDWNESKSGRPLDYGHWLAHRLEKLSNHRLFHGEAVSIGVAVDSFISYRRGLLSEEELKMILDLQVNKLKLPIDDELLDESYRDQIMKGLTEFQSHLGSKAIPLLNGIGRTVDVLDMNERDSLEEVDYAIQAIRHFKNTGTILGARLTSHRESEAVLSYKNKAGALNTIDRLKIKAARTVAADTGFENIEEKIKAFKKAQRYLSKAGMLAHKYHEGVADISLLQAVNFLQQARGYRSQNEIKQTLHFYEAALQRAKRSLGIDRDEKTLLLLHEIETERNDLKSGARLSTNDFFAEIRALDQDYGPHSIDGYFSNEEGIDRLLEQLDKLPGKGSGIHIGFSGWLNLAIMAKRRSQYGILLDISGALPESFSKIEKVMRSLDIHASLSDRRRQFLDLMHTEFEGTPKDQLEKWMPWFNHDEEFDYIQNMFREGKIVYLRVDARTYEKFEVISKWMQKNNLKLDSLYASNVYETFSNPDVGVFVRDGNEVIHQQSFVKSMSFIAGPKTNFIEAGPRWISAAYPSLSVKFFNADELRARIGKFAGARLARQTAGRVSGVKNTPPTEKSVVEAKRRPDGILSGAQLVEPNIKIIKAEVGEILENSEALTAFLIRTYQNQRNQFPGSLALDIREDNGTIPVFKVDAQPTKESIRLALFYKGKEVFAVENLSQAIAELNKKKSPKERQALADLGFQSLERVSLRRLDSVLAPKNYSRSAGFVEIDLAKIARQFQGIPKEKEELESDLSLLFKKVALQSGNFYFSNSAILESLDASLKAQFLRLQLNRNNKGRVDTRRPENRIVAELYFDDSRPEPEIHVDSQKIVVYSSGFKNNQVPDFTVDLRIAQEAVDFYTTNAINGSIPVKDSKEEAELIEKLAQSDLYTAIKEFSLSRTSALIKAKEMHGIFTGHIKSYDLIRLIFIRPLLQFLDDRLKATRLMLQTQIAA